MTEYEFDDAQNATISRLAFVMRGVSVLEIVVGALFGVLAILGGVRGSLPAAIIYGGLSVATFAIAVALKSAAVSMRAVVGTSGADITHMLTGLQQLRRYFGVQKLVLMLFLVLFVVAIVVAVWLVL